MNEAAEQTPTEPSNTQTAEEEKIYSPQNELPFPESEVDLNEVFPDEESDLNELFPDEETKLLLKKIQRNKKDLHTMTDRFIDDDWGGIDNDGSKPSDEGNEPSCEDQQN